MRTTHIWNNIILTRILQTRFPPRLRSEVMKFKYPISEPIKENGIYLFGDTGTGKTLLAANLLIQQEKYMYLNNIPGQCVFMNTPELIQELLSCYGNPEKNQIEILEKYQKCPFLVLDDFGTEKPSEWVCQTLYLLINYRYEYLLPTVFTSNLSLEQIENNLGSRIPARIRRMGKVLKKKHWNGGL